MNINNYPETCVTCGRERTCDGSGVCQECEQAKREAYLDAVDAAIDGE